MPELDKIWRLSFCRMYYSSIENTETPSPFCEIRAFLILKNKPVGVALYHIKDRLIKAIEKTESLLEMDRDRRRKRSKKGKNWFDVVENESKSEEQEIAVSEKEGKIKVEINGFEIEGVDADELLKFFKETRAKIKFDRIYRYVAFFNKDGTIKADYTETFLADLAEEMGEE